MNSAERVILRTLQSTDCADSHLTLTRYLTTGGKRVRPEGTTLLTQEVDGNTGEGFSVYFELFSGGFLYLLLQGFPFEIASSALFTGNGPGTVVVRLPVEWTKKADFSGLISHLDFIFSTR